MRHRILLPMILSLLVVGILSFCTPSNSWSGVSPVELTFIVLDVESGTPISRSDVEIFNPFDEQKPAIRGETDRDGMVAVRQLFYSGGETTFFRKSEHVSFRPFAVRVVHRGYVEFHAFLAEQEDLAPSVEALHLKYPARNPIRILLRRENRQKTSGSNDR